MPAACGNTSAMSRPPQSAMSYQHAQPFDPVLPMPTTYPHHVSIPAMTEYGATGPQVAENNHYHLQGLGNVYSGMPAAMSYPLYSSDGVSNQAQVKPSDDCIDALPMPVYSSAALSNMSLCPAKHTDQYPVSRRSIHRQFRDLNSGFPQVMVL